MGRLGTYLIDDGKIPAAVSYSSHFVSFAFMPAGVRVRAGWRSRSCWSPFVLAGVRVRAGPGSRSGFSSSSLSAASLSSSLSASSASLSCTPHPSTRGVVRWCWPINPPVWLTGSIRGGEGPGIRSRSCRSRSVRPHPSTRGGARGGARVSGRINPQLGSQGVFARGGQGLAGRDGG
jgi:hypothetical protein